jgi:hypothetical protein
VSRVDLGRGKEQLGPGVEGDDREAIAVVQRVEERPGRFSGVGDGLALHRSRGVHDEGEVDAGPPRIGGSARHDAQARDEHGLLARGEEAVPERSLEGNHLGVAVGRGAEGRAAAREPEGPEKRGKGEWEPGRSSHRSSDA